MFLLIERVVLNDFRSFKTKCK